MADYDHQKIEKKWQKYWQIKKIFQTEEKSKKPKFYILDMFPYPSGEGLHVGHPKGYIGTDIVSRFKRMRGYNVLHPMGWDAFGLPAENYAIKSKTHPAQAVRKNIKRYKDQLAIIGFDYDWSREINTTNPDYYKWTQWIFLQLYHRGLVYESYEPINWCPSCQTGLANEDLEEGRCERCHSLVEKRPMRQWLLKITQYADRLLNDLEQLNWPESIKESQKNWIGRSEGALIKFPIVGNQPKIKEIEVFTTRPDTLPGATFLAIAADLAKKWLDEGWPADPKIKKYIAKTIAAQTIQNFKLKPEKTGVQTGLFAINPVNQDQLPVWVVNYVLSDVGTGAIMAVPDQDERDRDFAKKYNLPIKQVSAFGTQTEKEKLVKLAGGKFTVRYKLRDWVFSRQRYWGEPIPIVHCQKCGVVPVPEKDLPVELPKVKSYAPTGTGESPLANILKWVNTKCPKCRGPARRETNTMPQWAGSSWYYLRYLDPQNQKKLVNKDAGKYWLPVDLYVGGTEHATRHLIYARFWHKFLQDIGVVDCPEPFTQLKNQGLIYGADGKKMSKRFGNVVNPDIIVKTYGADTFRLHEMFLGPFEQSANWNTQSIIGPRRFLERVWKLQFRIKKSKPNSTENNKIIRLLNRAIKKITDDVERLAFNTAISSLMILVNDLEKEEILTTSHYETLLLLLAPFAPHITEELWFKLGHRSSIHLTSWPIFNPKLIKDEMMKLVVQIDGKTRSVIALPSDLSKNEAKKKVLNEEQVKRWLKGKAPKQVIYIPGRLINLVRS